MERTPTKGKTFTLTAADGSDITTDITNFANVIGLEDAAPGRYSLLLALGLFGGMKSGMLNPAKIVHEIKALEGTGSSKLKPPSQFKGPSLKGLWHKHYLADGLSTMARNLKNGIAKDGLPWLEQLVRDADASGEERYLTEDHIKGIVHDAVHANWMRRAGAQELTGEWLIYAKHEGVNYYLALGNHSSGDENLRMQIDALCCKEFPFLPALLANA